MITFSRPSAILQDVSRTTITEAPQAESLPRFEASPPHES